MATKASANPLGDSESGITHQAWLGEGQWGKLVRPTPGGQARLGGCLREWVGATTQGQATGVEEASGKETGRQEDTPCTARSRDGGPTEQGEQSCRERGCPAPGRKQEPTAWEQPSVTTALLQMSAQSVAGTVLVPKDAHSLTLEPVTVSLKVAKGLGRWDSGHGDWKRIRETQVGRTSYQPAAQSGGQRAGFPERLDGAVLRTWRRGKTLQTKSWWLLEQGIVQKTAPLEALNGAKPS